MNTVCQALTNAFMWIIQTMENEEMLLHLKSPHKAEILPNLTSDSTVSVRAYLAKFLIQIRCPGHCSSICGLIVHVKILQVSDTLEYKVLEDWISKRHHFVLSCFTSHHLTAELCNHSSSLLSRHDSM